MCNVKKTFTIFQEHCVQTQTMELKMTKLKKASLESTRIANKEKTKYIKINNLKVKLFILKSIISFTLR